MESLNRKLKVTFAHSTSSHMETPVQYDATNSHLKTPVQYKETASQTDAWPVYLNGTSTRVCSSLVTEKTTVQSTAAVRRRNNPGQSVESHAHSDKLEQVEYDSTVSLKNTLKSYLVALRPWSLSASLTPVSTGCVLAYKITGMFNIWTFIATIITALSVHAAGNLVNTYFDFQKGVDSKKSDDRTLVDQILKPQDVALLGGVFYFIGCLGFVAVTLSSPAKFEHISLLYFGGLSGSFLYTGGLGLKYIALGDILIILTFGPVTVMFSFLAQAGTLSAIPLIYAIPLALNTEAILHSNNARDMESDRRVGIVTLAIFLGSKLSYVLFVWLLFSPYIIFLVIGLYFTKWMFLPGVTIILAFQYERMFRNGNLTYLPQEIAKMNLILGFLFVIACICADASNLPSLIALT